MMTNSENPTGETAFVRVATSAVRGLIFGAIAVIFIYSGNYILCKDNCHGFIGFLFNIRIPYVASSALLAATIGAVQSADLRFVWKWILLFLSFSLHSHLFSSFFSTYLGWHFGEFESISALVFVLLLTIAGAGWGGRWTVLARPRPAGWFQ